MSKLLVFVFIILGFNCFAQSQQNTDSLRKVYYGKMKVVSNSFSSAYYPYLAQIYSLTETKFLKKVDSLKNPFVDELVFYKKKYNKIDKEFIVSEQRDIDYFFDRMILDYPYFHENHTGKKVHLSNAVQKRLDGHQKDFNNPSLLNSNDVKGYIQGFLRHQSSIEVKKNSYQKSDNKRLEAYLNLIPKYFTNRECREYWQWVYIFSHFDDWGGKHTEAIVKKFDATCTNPAYKKAIDSLFAESAAERNNHLIKTYKTVDGFNLDAHLFLPDSVDKSKKSPAIVYFSGGSWTKGNPEWDFNSCASYAKKGWVGVAVEYRVADRYETTPFEAVKDARSAIRWLRMNAGLYNIDTNRIVVSGNSAGGHLALTTVLATEWNEATDDFNYSASPNLAMINSGVYSLFSDDGTDWISRDLKDKSILKKISPLHLLRNDLPPIIVIHGTNDKSVEYSTAKEFAEEMKKLGNDFEFHTLEGAPHYIWFDRRFSGQVSTLRNDFLKKHGY